MTHPLLSPAPGFLSLESARPTAASVQPPDGRVALSPPSVVTAAARSVQAMLSWDRSSDMTPLGHSNASLAVTITTAPCTELTAC